MSTEMLSGAKCAKCKKRLPPYPGKGRTKRFCSAKCRLVAHRKGIKEMRPNVFFTPSHIVEHGRAAMTSIDLDPASCEAANATIKATAFFDEKQDGLQHDWIGNIWLNAPWGKFHPLFIRKLVAEYHAGRVKQAVIILKTTHVATGWFVEATKSLDFYACNPKSRINYSSPNYVTSSSPFPSIILGVGIPEGVFREHFGQLGSIAHFVSKDETKMEVAA